MAEPPTHSAGVMSSLIPLKQKVEFLWSYNSQVFSQAEADIKGQLCVSFLRQTENVVGVSYGLCGNYKLEYNNLLKKNESGVLFDVEKRVDVGCEGRGVAFAKGQQVTEAFQLSFPATTALFSAPMALPTSCCYYGDEQGYEPQLTVRYKLYVKITYVGGFPKKQRTETFSFPLTYQGVSMFQTAPGYTYRELAVYPGPVRQQQRQQSSKLLKLSKIQEAGAGLDLIMELSAPSALDMNAPLLAQLKTRFITNYSIGAGTDCDYGFRLKSLKVTVYYYSTFSAKGSTSRHRRKKNMFELGFDASVFSLRDFKYDSVNAYHYCDYRTQEHSAVTVNSMVGLHAFLTNCKLFEGKFTNTSCLHLTFKFADTNGCENTFKFRTEISPTVVSLPDDSNSVHKADAAVQYAQSKSSTENGGY